MSSVERQKFKGVDISPQQSDFRDSTSPYADKIHKSQVRLKQGELLENPTSLEDNQQPSLISNDFEGSTTNSRILIKDGNANTSALPINENSYNYPLAKMMEDIERKLVYGDDIV